MDDMYRRNTLKDWWDDVGYIYAIAIALIAVVFLLKDVAQTMSSLPAPPEPTAQATTPPYK